MTDHQSATIFRMVLPDHTCPFGVMAKQRLEQLGCPVEDHVLRSREEVDAFEAEHKIQTTPLIFIDGEQIGGCEDLEAFLARR